MSELFNKGSEWRRWDLHIHTASSYDYKYQGDNPNEKLVEVLRKNNISVVAITDHFLIDKQRFLELRNSAPDIVFFPGVELRTDKGDTNIHVILIFSEKINLDNLVTDFDVFKRSKGKAIEKNETIFWEYRDIVDFAREHFAIISIHAGSKTNGIDKQISNLLPENIATKADYAKTVDIFEGGNVQKDISDYEKYKFPKYGKKPLIFCSDNHNPLKYEPAAPCWFKADPTFEGLKQVIIEPDRIFVGDKPDLLKKIEKAPQKFLNKLFINKKDTSTLDEVWYDNFSLELNPGLVSIIGNKGSGKSAIADILSLCSNTHNNKWSFLTNTKFRKKGTIDRSKSFEASISWADNSTSEKVSLDQDGNIEKPELVRYIPQNYLETLCTTEDSDVFEEELKSIIFQYLPGEQKKGNEKLNDVIDQLSQEIKKTEETFISYIKEQNRIIVNLEEKQKPEYKKRIVFDLEQKKLELENLIKAKPEEVEKPAHESDVNQKLQKSVETLNKKLEEINTEQEKIRNILSENKNKIQELNSTKECFSRIKNFINTEKNSIREILSSNDLNVDDVILLTIKESVVNEKIQSLENENAIILQNLNSQIEDSLESKKVKLLEEITKKTKALSEPDRLYQNYLKELKKWKNECDRITGDESTPSTIQFYEKQIEYLDTKLESDLMESIEKREACVKNLIQQKKKILDVYANLYHPITQFISDNKDFLKNFPIEIKSSFAFDNISEKLFDFINQGVSGSFSGRDTGIAVLRDLCETVEFDKENTIVEFASKLNNSLLNDIREGKEGARDIESQLKKGHSKVELYDFIYGMSYIKHEFQLEMSKKPLSSLSPGERGAILLLFYLFIDNDDKPLIIDQPEENLDNESVYKYLVSFIKEAKKRRQVIMVTHNPNLAVVCDADQIIKMDIAKDNKNIVSYQSGSIENPVINKCIVDVLEGTYPAFDNRNRKYLNKNEKSV